MLDISCKMTASCIYTHLFVRCLTDILCLTGDSLDNIYCLDFSLFRFFFFENDGMGSCPPPLATPENYLLKSDNILLGQPVLPGANIQHEASSRDYNDGNQRSKIWLSVRPEQPRKSPDNQKYWCGCPMDNQNVSCLSCETLPYFPCWKYGQPKTWDGQREIVTWLSVGQPFICP